jgi:alanyl-tRNA synthetase
MLSNKIRSKFLDYFKKNGHTVVPSSSVVPHDDPSLLFINAGMNQFKDVFLGSSVRDYTRATSSQKCIRVGGKHNDLENVGHTSRHLTFFEMLGNFSFGDYFKKEAIRFAWEVSTQVFEFDAEKIYPTVYKDDDEAFELWKAIVPESRITRFGEKENFWAMGETGPCGPSSEMLYDRGPSFGSATKPSEDAEGERFLEFWNLVFMQFNRFPDGKTAPLPKPSIDTGAGLERVVSLKMGVDSVYETDILRALIGKVEEISGKKYNGHDPAFRVIADHLRTLAFAIADGVQPSNLDRGYVLRKVLRRAVRYGRQLGFEDPFLAKVYPGLIEAMGQDYPELKSAKNRIEEILTLEEEAFLKTLKRGGALLGQIVEKAQKGKHEISGDDAFKLKDTYGLPFEEIQLLAKDSQLTVDEKRFAELEGEAKERSRATQKMTGSVAAENLFDGFVKENGPTQFLGYQETSAEGVVKAIVKDGAFVQEVHPGDEVEIVLDQTPFYAEMGGQVGDTGLLAGAVTVFEVSDCRAPFKGVISHIGTVRDGKISVGDKLKAQVDVERRQKIANNHTATHLLHYALQQVLGEHIKQAGSVVDPQRLRFDFSHHKPLTPSDIAKIEDIVNGMVRSNHVVETYELSFEDVKKRSDIKQFFGEKYGSRVRVVESGDAKELCGGTHTSSTGNIGYFRIAKESSIAAGVRRIEAVTGSEAETLSREPLQEIERASTLLKVPAPKVLERIEKLLEENKGLAQELKTLRQKELAQWVETLFNEKETLRGVSVVARELPLAADELRVVADQLMDKMGSGIVLLGQGSEGKAQIYLKLSDNLVKQGLHAGAIIKDLAPLIEGSGGGKESSATAGGKAREKLQLALLKVKEYVP